MNITSKSQKPTNIHQWKPKSNGPVLLKITITVEPLLSSHLGGNGKWLLNRGWPLNRGSTVLVY